MKTNTDKISKSFGEHNFHDCLLKGIHIYPAINHKSKSTIEVVLEDYEKKEFIQSAFVKNFLQIDYPVARPQGVRQFDAASQHQKF